VADEGVIDPRLIAMREDNPFLFQPFADLSPDMLALARGPAFGEPSRPIARVTDDEVDGIPVRIYEHDDEPAGLVVYLHGGGWVIGSIGIMDNVAREIAHAGHVAVVSVGYRLAPEDPYPAGLDDCEAVVRWAVAHADRFGASPEKVVVAGESAGGNLSAAVTLRRREAGDARLAGQLLIYPSTGGTRAFPSRDEFEGIVLSHEAKAKYWDAYTGGRDLADDPYVAPLAAASLRDLPPALVQLGGCDVLRDEGRAYATRLREDGVDVEEICYPGQPHGFVNMGFPAAADAFADLGVWLRKLLG